MFRHIRNLAGSAAWGLLARWQNDVSLVLLQRDATAWLLRQPDALGLLTTTPARILGPPTTADGAHAEDGTACDTQASPRSRVADWTEGWRGQATAWSAVCAGLCAGND